MLSELALDFMDWIWKFWISLVIHTDQIVYELILQNGTHT